MAKMPQKIGLTILLLACISGILILFVRATAPSREEANLDARTNAAKLVLAITENGNDDVSRLRVISITEMQDGSGFEIAFADNERKVQRRLVNLNTGDIFRSDENGEYRLPDYSQETED